MHRTRSSGSISWIATAASISGFLLAVTAPAHPPQAARPVISVVAGSDGHVVYTWRGNRVIDPSHAGCDCEGSAIHEVPSAGEVVWRLDNISRVGGHPLTVEGSPRIVESALGPVVEFDGKTDGIFIDSNPLAGLERFTLQVVFNPAEDGQAEQRFFHAEEATTGNRALIELRLSPDRVWSLDTFLRYGEGSLTLLDRARTHPAGRWHVAALTFDGKTMAHYVDGVRELSGIVGFKALGAGRTSIGVRQNKVSHFKGLVALVRIAPEALTESQLLRSPQK
jgi:hypothetical protein